MALKELKNNSVLNLKKKQTKIQQSSRITITSQSTDGENMQKRVNEIIDQMRQGKHIDDMTKSWLSKTPNPPRIPNIL